MAVSSTTQTQQPTSPPESTDLLTHLFQMNAWAQDTD